MKKIKFTISGGLNSLSIEMNIPDKDAQIIFEKGKDCKEYIKYGRQGLKKIMSKNKLKIDHIINYYPNSIFEI